MQNRASLGVRFSLRPYWMARLTVLKQLQTSLMGHLFTFLVFAVALVGCDRSDPIVLIQLHPKNPDIIYIATNDYILEFQLQVQHSQPRWATVLPCKQERIGI